MGRFREYQLARAFCGGAVVRFAWAIGFRRAFAIKDGVFQPGKDGVRNSQRVCREAIDQSGRCRCIGLMISS